MKKLMSISWSNLWQSQKINRDETNPDRIPMPPVKGIAPPVRLGAHQPFLT